MIELWVHTDRLIDLADGELTYIIHRISSLETDC